jgi:hypothetical protein
VIQKYKVISLKTKQEIKIGDVLDEKGTRFIGFKLKLFDPRGVILVDFGKNDPQPREYHPHIYGLEIVLK